MEDETRIWRKLHQHPLVPENRTMMCNAHCSENCRGYGTVRSCGACCFYVCQGCWDATKEQVETADKAKEKVRRGLDGELVGEAEDVADVLHALAKVDDLDEGAMSGSDDGGDRDDGGDDEDDDALRQKVATAKQMQLEMMKKSLYGGKGGPNGGGLFGDDEDEDGEEE